DRPCAAMSSRPILRAASRSIAPPPPCSLGRRYEAGLTRRRPCPHRPGGKAGRGSGVAPRVSDSTGDAPTPRPVDVVVVGAAPAGLSAAYHLRRRGFVAPQEAGEDARTYVVLDGEAGPGGAWRHRWRSLRMATVNGI